MINIKKMFHTSCVMLTVVGSSHAMVRMPTLAHYHEDQFKPFIERASREPIAILNLYPLFREPTDAIEQLELLDVMLDLPLLTENKKRFIEMWAFINRIPLKIVNRLEKMPYKQAISKLERKGRLQTPERAELALFYILRLKDHLERDAMHKKV